SSAPLSGRGRTSEQAGLVPGIVPRLGLPRSASGRCPGSKSREIFTGQRQLLEYARRGPVSPRRVESRARVVGKGQAPGQGQRRKGLVIAGHGPLATRGETGSARLLRPGRETLEPVRVRA